MISFRAHTRPNLVLEADRAQVIAIDLIFVKLIPHISVTLKHGVGDLIHFSTRFITEVDIVIFEAKPFLLRIKILAIVLLLSGFERVLGLQMTFTGPLTQEADQILLGIVTANRSF